MQPQPLETSFLERSQLTVNLCNILSFFKPGTFDNLHIILIIFTQTYQNLKFPKASNTANATSVGKLSMFHEPVTRLRVYHFALLMIKHHMKKLVAWPLWTVFEYHSTVKRELMTFFPPTTVLLWVSNWYERKSWKVGFALRPKARYKQNYTTSASSSFFYWAEYKGSIAAWKNVVPVLRFYFDMLMQ